MKLIELIYKDSETKSNSLQDALCGGMTYNYIYRLCTQVCYTASCSTIYDTLVNVVQDVLIKALKSSCKNSSLQTVVNKSYYEVKCKRIIVEEMQPYQQCVDNSRCVISVLIIKQK